MCSVAQKVRDKVAKFDQNTPFTSKEMLGCGGRNAVDIELCRLVKDGKILRLTSGLFIRVESGMQIPPPLEIARIKAERFSKRLYEAEDPAQKKSLVKDARAFHTDGAQSSIQTIHGWIMFKHRAPGKIAAAIQKATENLQCKTTTIASKSSTPSSRQARNNPGNNSVVSACQPSTFCLPALGADCAFLFYWRFTCRS